MEIDYWADDDDDLDIDVCQGCGAYYGADDYNRKLWIQTIWDRNPEGTVQPQLCNDCIKK